MDERKYIDIMELVMPSLTPYEQVLYGRLFYLTHVQGKDQAAVRYEDLARACNLSLSAVQRTVRGLKAKKLIKTHWQRKHAMLFTVFLTPARQRRLTTARPSVLDLFSREDRELFLTIRRGLTQEERQAIEEAAAEWLEERGLDESLLEDKRVELIVHERFGPARAAKYEHCFAPLYQSQ